MSYKCKFGFNQKQYIVITRISVFVSNGLFQKHFLYITLYILIYYSLYLLFPILFPHLLPSILSNVPRLLLLCSIWLSIYLSFTIISFDLFHFHLLVLNFSGPQIILIFLLFHGMPQRLRLNNCLLNLTDCRFMHPITVFNFCPSPIICSTILSIVMSLNRLFDSIFHFEFLRPLSCYLYF